MKKCPRCEMNWIEDTDEYCALCLQDMSPSKPQQKKPKQVVRFNESFTFKSAYVYDGKRGYKAYNSQGEHVGIVFMTDDKRLKAYGYCELHFFPEYEERYGVWHRILSNGVRLPWKPLCDIMKSRSEYSCFVDD